MGDGRVPVQVQRPALVAVDAFMDGFPTGAVAVDVAVLEYNARPVGSQGRELHLDLAGVLRVGLDLPSRADVPAEHHPSRGFVGEDSSPSALGAVRATVN